MTHLMPASRARDVGQPAIAAFRADLPLGGRPLTAADEDLVAIATLLRHATLEPHGRRSKQMVGEARRIATRLVGERRATELPEFDAPGDPSPFDVFRIVADRCREQGQSVLQDHLYESLLGLVAPGTITAGRIAVSRAFAALDVGAVDLAQAQLMTILADDSLRRHKEIELRAWVNLAAAAQARGNLPECERLARKVLRAARPPFVNQMWGGHFYLGTVAALRRDFDAAVKHMWTAYQLGHGLNRVDGAALLNNLCQVLLDAGFPAPARAGFARILADGPPLRFAFVVLSSYAMASAALDDRAGLEWATQEVLRLSKVRSYPWYIALSYLECSLALAAVGEERRAGTLRRRALRLAERHGYHDLTFRAERFTRDNPVLKAPLTEAASAIAAIVSDMEPGSLPRQLAHAD